MRFCCVFRFIFGVLCLVDFGFALSLHCLFVRFGHFVLSDFGFVNLRILRKFVLNPIVFLVFFSFRVCFRVCFLLIWFWDFVFVLDGLDCCDDWLFRFAGSCLCVVVYVALILI